MPITLPTAIARAFELIRKRHPHASVSQIRNGFYVVESVARHSESKGRNVTVSLYLGRILDDGRFVPARHRKAKNEVSSVYKLAEVESESDESISFDDADRRILETLSNDSRTSAAGIAKKLGIGVGSINYRIGRLEKRLGMRYEAELNTTEFGFSRFAVMVRFLSGKPTEDEVREALGPEPLLLCAFSTKGAYDLFFIVLAETTYELEKWMYRIKTLPQFRRFAAKWVVSYITVEQGYIPVREEFLQILKGRVWHKSKETPVRESWQLLEREYAVLEELCRNGNADFAEIDRKHAFGKGAAHYTYHKLLERRQILRTTIGMDRPPISYVAIIHADQDNMDQFVEHRELFFRTTITDSSTVLNKFTMVCGFGTPYGLLFFAPVYRGGAVEGLEAELSKIKGFNISSLIITSTIIGGLGFRRLISMDQSPYSSLIKHYGYTEDKLAQLIRGAHD